MSLEQPLHEHLETLGVGFAAEPLLNYLHLLLKWNNTYNLTAIRHLDSMISQHVFDSLAILPWIKGPRLVDVGTGAGFPGIPLAIVNPSLSITLLDSNGKKIRFLREVKRALRLENIEIVQSRAENYHPSSGFDTVTSRALSDLNNLIKWTRHLLADQGHWLAMKGRYPEAELTEITLPYRVETYTVPTIQGDRCCVIIDNKPKEPS